MDREICEKCEVKKCGMLFDKENHTVRVLNVTKPIENLSGDEASEYIKMLGVLCKDSESVIVKDDNQFRKIASDSEIDLDEFAEFEDSVPSPPSFFAPSLTCPYALEHLVSLLSKEENERGNLQGLPSDVLPNHANAEL